jgi:aerobic carbon-monoxide dehydrogenase large subunit
MPMALAAFAPVAVFNGRDGRPMFTTRMPVLAAERVRYVGEAVAIVVAETLPQALDAAEKVEVDYEHLPAVSDVARAMAAHATLVWPEAAGNIALDWEEGDAAAVDAAFARAAHVERVRLFDTRLAPSAMEPRAAIATFDKGTERYTLIAPTQGVAVVRKVLAESVFKVPADKIRILTHDVGGGFDVVDGCAGRPAEGRRWESVTVKA